MGSKTLVIASVVIPTALVLLAYLLTPQEVKGTWRRLMLKIGFLVLAVVGVIVALKIEDSHYKEIQNLQADISEIKGILIPYAQNAADFASLKKQVADLASKLPFPTPSEKVKQTIRQLGNIELVERARDLIRRMKQSAMDYEHQRDAISDKYFPGNKPIMSRQISSQLSKYNAMEAELVQLNNQYVSEVKSTFLDEAISLRDELIKRLPQGSIPKNEGIAFFQGLVVGTSVDFAADYLEKLVSMLPQ